MHRFTMRRDTCCACKWTSRNHYTRHQWQVRSPTHSVVSPLDRQIDDRFIDRVDDVPCRDNWQRRQPALWPLRSVGRGHTHTMTKCGRSGSLVPRQGAMFSPTNRLNAGDIRLWGGGGSWGLITWHEDGKMEWESKIKKYRDLRYRSVEIGLCYL